MTCPKSNIWHHNGTMCQIYIVLNSKAAIPFFVQKMVRIMAINCISYSLKALSVSTFKDTLHSHLISENFHKGKF